MRIKKILKVLIFIVVIFLSQLLLIFLTDTNNKDVSRLTQLKNKILIFNKREKKEKPNTKEITLSFVGDCTIGWDEKAGYGSRFDKYLKDNNYDYSYYFNNVKDIFKNDDMTIANLEGTFTSSNNKVEKKFNFKAPKEYANVLVEGNVDVVSFTNNHAHDYGNGGYKDTIDTLDEYNIEHFEYDNYLIKEIEDVKICMFAMHDIYAKKYDESLKAINKLKQNNCDIIIASFHWGIEGDDKQSDFQVNMGHFLIDNGVDLVIGHHPHRIQGIENYKGKYIVYSLGNFVFGGNHNPDDKDTFIFQETFSYKNGKLDKTNINIITAKISGVNNKNNYQPVILNGDEKNRVLNRILKNSKNI